MRKSLFIGIWVASMALPLLAEPLSIYTEIAPPAQFIGSDGQLTGLAVEMVREIQKRIGNADPIEVVPWIRGYKEIESRPNVVLLSMARTVERDSLFEWVGPTEELQYSFFVRSQSDIRINSLEDAKRLRQIGVYKEDVRERFLTQAGFTNLDRSINQPIMLKKLMDNRIDALVSSPETITEFAKGEGIDPNSLKEAFVFLKVQIFIAFSKGTSPSILQAWSMAFDSMKKDGTFKRIYRKYYPTRPLPGPAVSPKS